VSVKQTKHRLFLGNVDRTKSKKELVAALQLMAGGMEQLDLPKNHIHKGQNKVGPGRYCPPFHSTRPRLRGVWGGGQHDSAQAQGNAHEAA